MQRAYVVSAAVAALLAAMAFVAAGGTELGRTTIAELLVVAVCATLVVAALVSRRRGPVSGSIPLIALAALVAFTALSVGWSVVPDLSFIEAGRSFAYLAVFAGAIAAARLAPTASPVLLRGILAACVVVCLYGLISRVWPGALAPTEQAARLGQPFGYWNAVGSVAAIGIIPALWMGAKRSSGLLERALAFPAAGVLMLAMLLTQSRGAVVALAIGAIVWFAFVPLRLRSLAVLALGVAGAAPVAAWGLSKAAFTVGGTPLPEREAVAGTFGLLVLLMIAALLVAGLAASYGMARVVPTMRVRRRVGLVVAAALLALPLALFTSVASSDRGVSGTISDRVDELTSETAAAPPEGAGRLTVSSSSRARYWREAGDVFDERPGKGTGAGTFYVSRLRYRKDELVAQHAHGYVPQTMSDLGVVGLVLSALALVTWLACALRAVALVPRLRRRREPREPIEWTGERTALLGLVIVAVVFGVQSAIDWTWFVPGVTVVALAAAGFVAGRGALRGSAAGVTAALGPEPTGEGRVERPPWARTVATVGVVATAALLASAIWQPERANRASAQALSDIEQGKLGSAADAARTARDADPLAAEPRFAEASVASAAGKEGLARRILERTVREFPGNPQTWLRLAEFELHHSEPLRALEVVRGALYLDPFSKAARRVRDQARAAALADVTKGTPEERRKREELLRRNGLLPGGPHPRRRRRCGRRGGRWSRGRRRRRSGCARRRWRWPRQLQGQDQGPRAQRRADRGIQMRRRHRALLTAAAAAAALAAPVSSASASSSQESIFQDDNLLVTGSDAQVESTMSTLRSLGVERIRVSVIWRFVAPGATSASRPSFNASDPAAYGASAWNRYDRIVDAARRYGIGLLFSVTGPSPRWATGDKSEPRGLVNPSAGEFGQFVTAVGRRYSGTYADEQPQSSPPSGGGGGGGVLPLSRERASATAAGGVLPRVTMWSVWNEPQQPGWLRPQVSGGRPASPHIYRRLLDAAWAGLRASGHGSDNILIGELAPRGTRRLTTGPMTPLRFLRELYCVNSRIRPLRGGEAAARGCPTDSAGTARFRSQHPGLFDAPGFAHHPYALEVAPSKVDRIRDQVTIASLGRLTRTLDRVQRRYGSRRRMPIWLTEYGYQTDPPDPTIVGQPWSRQAAYINEADHIASRNRRVRSVAQFLLVDDQPNREVPPSNIRYWGSTFQSGLITIGGRRKPSFFSYMRSIDVYPKRVRRGRAVRVYGQLRPAPNGSVIRASLQFRRTGSRRWRTVKRVRSRSFRNIVRPRVRVRSSGRFRFVWREGSRRNPTRSSPVRVVRRRR